MSPALKQSGRSGQVHELVADNARIPARAYPSAGRPGLAHLVLLDSAAVPGPAQFHEWGRQLASFGYDRMRTGALASRQAAQAELAGLQPVQVLALLEAVAPFPHPTGPMRLVRPRTTRRLRLAHLSATAEIDRAAFGELWRLDATMLRDVCSATPSARARIVRTADVQPSGTDGWSGFLICGRAGRTAYVQRLAVHPDALRRGLARLLLLDGLAWFHRWHAERVLVNTEVGNDAALALYRAHGFRDLPDRLVVYEGQTEQP